jgi:hypothetical protein
MGFVTAAEDRRDERQIYSRRKLKNVEICFGFRCRVNDRLDHVDESAPWSGHVSRPEGRHYRIGSSFSSVRNSDTGRPVAPIRFASGL